MRRSSSISPPLAKKFEDPAGGEKSWGSKDARINVDEIAGERDQKYPMSHLDRQNNQKRPYAMIRTA